jgi:hypothetical protein
MRAPDAAAQGVNSLLYPTRDRRGQRRAGADGREVGPLG